MLEWEELPTGQDSRMATYLNDVDPDDKRDWPRQHAEVRVRPAHADFSCPRWVLESLAIGNERLTA